MSLEKFNNLETVKEAPGLEFEEVAELSKNPSSIEKKPSDELDKLKSEIEDLPEYKAYQNQKVRMETLESLPEELDNLEQEKGSGEDKEKAKDIINNLIKEVTSSIEEYNRAIEIVAVHSETKKFRMEEEEYNNWLESMDRRRGISHDKLISNLSILSRFCCGKNLRDKKLKTLDTMLGVSFPQNKLFSGNDLKDRKLIGEWALTMGDGIKIMEVLDEINKTKEKAG